MAYDEGLAQRVREALAQAPDLVEEMLTEKKMFGGVGFLVAGNMACGVLREDLIVRVGPDAWNEALARPQVREFDITGRSMRGWVMVAADALEDDAELLRWTAAGARFAATLPAK